MKSDDVTVKQCLEGDVNAFSFLVEKYQHLVYGLCYHMVGNFADAQDLAQEAFVKAYTALSGIRDPSKFASWIYRITMDTCKLWLRDRKGMDDLPLETVAQVGEVYADGESPAEHAEAEELCLSVKEAIASLPERNQLPVTLYYIDGLSYAEIGNFLSLSESAVKSRLHRAREQLKEGLISMVENSFSEHKLPEDFPERIRSIIPGKTTRERLMEVFGEPDSYYDGEGEAVSKEELPDRIEKGLFSAMVYDSGVHFALYGDDTIGEVRIESNEDYAYEGKIRLGSSLEDVISFLGEPSEIVTGKPIDFRKNRVLYRDTEGRTGDCYIDYRDLGVRMFFLDCKVCALYLRVPDTTP